uniref:Protein kinase domain-containing protein n=1 Tax=Caenorhabditis japonica TaxID=281687 RepID=A0A8R1HN18_CAEJA
MTHQCLTYLASSAALVSTLAAFPTSGHDDDSHEDWWTHRYKTTTSPTPPTMDDGTQTDYHNPPGSNNQNNQNVDLSASDIRYLETITNLSLQGLDNVQDTIDDIDDPKSDGSPSQNLTPDRIQQYQPYQSATIQLGPPPTLPTIPHLTTPSYYDPYYGDHKYTNDGGVNAVALGLGLGIPLGIIAAGLAVFIFFWCRKRRRQNQNPFPLPFPKKVNDYEAQLDSPAYSVHDPWILDRNNLEINYSKKLGSGAFCNVFRGKINGEAPVSQIHPGQRTQQLRDCPVAVKMLPSFADDAARSDFMQEINFMKSLAYHPHLVSMLGFVADRKSPYLLVEFCEHGDLLHMIRNKRQEIIEGPNVNADGLKIKDLLMFSWQISNGLEYLNNIGCIHRDIAARNVLVDTTNTCKIGDFGLCRLTDSLLYTARGGRLPLKWMAPESLSSYEYSFKSDVYDVMKSCWEEHPENRPAFQQTSTVLTQMLESATENYGYLVPRNFNNQMKESNEQCDNV